MADNKKNISTEKSKNSENFFVKVWKKLVKLCKDTVGELKKVSWTPKAEVIKSFKLVLATVVGVSLVIAAIDFGSSLISNTIANLIG